MDYSVQSTKKVTTKRGKHIEVASNEEPTELSWDDPLLTEAMTAEFPAEKLRAAMSKEMQSMDYFGVYEEVDANSLTEQRSAEVIGTRFVNVWKGNEVKARLVAQGFSQKRQLKRRPMPQRHSC